MSRFKPGDRIQLKPEYQAQIRSMNKVVGTIREVVDGLAHVVLDEMVVTIAEDGEKLYFKEGILEKQLEPFFEVIEKSDWASMWDDAATSDESN